MKKIYVMGNLLVDIDSLPVRLLPKLKKELPNYEILEIDPSEDIKPENKEMIIIDTVINAKKVSLITDIDKIMLESVCSLHDFDLGYNLKLMKKFGMIEKVNIIGIPPSMDEETALEEIKKLIRKI